MTKAQVSMTKLTLIDLRSDNSLPLCCKEQCKVNLYLQRGRLRVVCGKLGTLMEEGKVTLVVELALNI